MKHEKIALIAEGKTKKVWQTQSEKHVIVEFKDDAMTFHGKKPIYFEGKGRLSNEINAILMRLLEESGIETHFVELYAADQSVVHRVEMIPVEVVVRNYVAGSMAARLGLEQGMKLKAPVLEFCYKNDQLNDPVINEYHAYAMGLATREDLAEMCYIVGKVNKLLTDALLPLGIVVADFKLEFGKARGRLLIADEITPTTARLWDANTMSKFCEKDDFYDVKCEYQMILDKLTQLKIG
jgi:phosphoribosylaminoimidazole-succinocarboxamide synthase